VLGLILLYATIIGHFGFVFQKNSVRKIIVFDKLCFLNVFSSHENEKLSFLNFRFDERFRKLRYRDWLVLGGKTNRSNKALFQVFGYFTKMV